MKKTILRTVMLAAIASLTMSGYVFAHHPVYSMDEDLYYRIDENISDQHNEMIGDVEDYVFMGQIEDNAAVDTPTNQSQEVGGAATSSMTSSQSADPSGTASGRSNANQVNRAR